MFKLRQPFVNIGACTPGTSLHSGQRVQVPQRKQFHEQLGVCFLISAWYSILLFVLSLCFKVRVSGSCIHFDTGSSSVRLVRGLDLQHNPAEEA